jgi:hypothetical protein
MSIKFDKIIDDLRELDRSLNYSFSRKNNATNIYLENNGIFSNLTPIIISENCLLKSISASTDGNENWIAEIHGNGTLISGATLNIVSSDSGIENDLYINIPAGTKLSVYCNGINIRKPNVTIELIK